MKDEEQVDGMAQRLYNSAKDYHGQGFRTDMEYWRHLAREALKGTDDD